MTEELDKLVEEGDRLNDAAVIAWNSGRELEAISFAEQSLDIDPGNVFAHINLYYFHESINAREDGEMIRAKRQVEKVLERNPPKSPAVSVILPTYGRPEFLKEAIESVLAQTMDDFELIVVNDGGAAEAEEISLGFGDRRVRYMLITHSGLPGAMNEGLHLATGEYVAYLDDDDLYRPDHLETLLAESKKNSRDTVLYTDADKIEGVWEGDGWKWSEPKPFYREDYDRLKLMRQNYIHNQCVLHSRDMALEVGGYHEGINFGINWEMWIKLGARFPFRRIPKATVIYRDRKDGGTMSTDPERRRQHSRNVILYTHRVIKFRRSEIKYATKLDTALGNVLDKYPELLDMLDLRKVVIGKPYSMLYDLGKALERTGSYTRAREAYRCAMHVTPWETKSFFRWLSMRLKGADRSEEKWNDA